jgi:serine/threonine protein kinase
MASGKKNCYNFSVDMYSLGVVLLDLFRRHDVFH